MVEPRQAEHGNDDSRSGRVVETANGANLLRAAVRYPGRDEALPARSSVWFRVRCVWEGLVSFS